MSAAGDLRRIERKRDDLLILDVNVNGVPRQQQQQRRQRPESPATKDVPSSDARFIPSPWEPAAWHDRSICARSLNGSGGGTGTTENWTAEGGRVGLSTILDVYKTDFQISDSCTLLLDAD